MNQTVEVSAPKAGYGVSYDSSVLYRWLFVSVLLSGDVAVALTFVISPALPGLAHHFGGGSHADFLAQNILTILGLGSVAGGLVGGWILQRFGPRKVLLVTLPIYGLSGAAGLVLDDPWTLGASRVVLGFTASCYVIATMWLIAEVYVGTGRARIVGFKTALACLTGVVGVLLSGVLVQEFGWRAPFILYVVLAAPILIFSLVTVPANAIPAAQADSSPEHTTLKALWGFFLLLTFLYVLVTMNNAQLPFLLFENGTTVPATQSLILSLSTLCITVGCLLYGSLYSRLPQAVYVISFSFAGIGWAIIGLSHSLLVTVAGVIVGGLAIGLFMPHNVHVVMGRVGPKVRGHAIGLYMVMTALGAFLNPFLVAPLATKLGLHDAFFGAAALWEIAAALAFVLVRWQMSISRLPRSSSAT